MNIGIDPGVGQSKMYPVFHYFLLKWIGKLALLHPEHSFIIYNTNKEQEPMPFNMSTGVRRKRKQFFGLANTTDESAADHLFECFYTGASVSSGSTLIIPELSPLIYPEKFSRKEKMVFRRSLQKAVSRSKTLLVTSDHYQKVLLQTFKLPEEKVRVLSYHSGSMEANFSWQETEVIKELYTGGKEYFLFAGDLHPGFDLLILLKAFSLFKKWQKSNMQLVIAGYEVSVSSPLVSLLPTYKYKEDVVLIQNPSEEQLKNLTGAAYAFVYPALYDHFPLTLLNAMRMQVPVISADLPEIREIGGNAVVYSTIDEELLSANMQRMYKDESWRKDVIGKATNHQRQMIASESIPLHGILLNELIAK